MASRQELEWWNRFAPVMAEQWSLTPAINSRIRADYEHDYFDFLFKARGTLLEIGCGTGWIGRRFADYGMDVDGIDFSEEQLAIARRSARRGSAGSVAYFRRDLVRDTLAGRFSEYDSVLVNAVLHHLSATEVQALLRRISAALAPGGRVYMYEPFQPTPSKSLRRSVVATSDFIVRSTLFIINRAALLSLFKPHFAEAKRAGYTGTSPDERPLVLSVLSQSLRQAGLEVLEHRPFHGYSLAIAMSLVRLRSPLVSALTPLTSLMYTADALLFRYCGWTNYSPRSAVLCSIKALKPVASIDTSAAQ